MAFKNHYTDLAIIILCTLCFIFLINIAEYFLLLADAPYMLMTVLIFPISEEIYKYLFAKYMQRKAFMAILIFAVFEVFAVKITLLYFNGGVASWLFLFSIIPPFIFHIATAFNYTNYQFFDKSWTVLYAMITLHCLFNYLSYLISDDVIFFVCAMLFALTPLLWLLLSNRILNRNAVLG